MTKQIIKSLSILVAGSMLLGASATASAAGGVKPKYKASVDVSNTDSLRRGSKYFVNYCLGCHSLKYVRYNSLLDDLNISEEQLSALMFTQDKSTEMMTIAMPAEDAERWFGIAPPDLSLTARSKGADWIYSYLKTFYVEEGRPAGVNNLTLKGASMPHVLAPLQGYQRAVFETVTDADGNPHEEFKGFETVTEGSLSAGEYDAVVNDITTFLVYVSEPVQLKRQSVGIGVLAFLLVFFLFAYFLKREIWKDVH